MGRRHLYRAASTVALPASLLSAVLAGPACGQTAPMRPVLQLSRTSPWTADASRAIAITGWEAPARRAALTVPVAERVELVAVGSKERAPKAWSAVQRTSGPAGRAQVSKGARVGVLVRW